MAEKLKIRCRFCSQKLDVSELEPFTRVECPACSASVVVPRPLDNLLLEELIGEGGMAWVYRALDTTLDRKVAVKIPFPEISQDSESVDSFLHEARAAAAVNHPNVVSIYSCGTGENNEPYLVMEYMSNYALDYIMRRREGRPLEERDAVNYISYAARGLQGALRKGIVHHDVKPGNILLDNEGNVRVGDFGLAQVGHFAQNDVAGWGSPYYMSPEKVTTGGEDYRGDIYSLGATLYHMLAGQVPFDGPDSRTIRKARLNRPPPDVREVNANVSEQVALVTQWMMQETPDERPQSYDTLIERLATLSVAQGDSQTMRLSGVQQTLSGGQQGSAGGEPTAAPKRVLKRRKNRSGDDRKASLTAAQRRRRRRQRARMVNWAIVFGVLGLILLVLVGAHRNAPWAVQVLRQYNSVMPAWMDLPVPSGKGDKDKPETNNSEQNS